MKFSLVNKLEVFGVGPINIPGKPEIQEQTMLLERWANSLYRPFSTAHFTRACHETNLFYLPP
jgi:hypothetical protein